ncbi:hypothetical protein Cpir12675_004183 [Ceratocystis pirilliformis]|uniref:Methyltransferase-like protein 7B n=1 Tax=Ceratocystis pirilliformis TaxID=259994 RepID=A0ABR3YZI9_9PEZI
MNNSPVTFWDHVQWFLDPWLFLGSTLAYLPGTITSLLRTGQIHTILWPPALRDAFFGRFWASFGPNLRESNGPVIAPIIAGRITHGKETTVPVYEPLGGSVIEVGAGSGMWADALIAAGAQRILGIEPNPAQHAALRKRVAELGFEKQYEVVPVGIEDISRPDKWDGHIEKESIDCIVTLFCLCSIPDPDKNVKELYKYLKKGGRWFLYEHVRTPDSAGRFIRWYQRFVNLFWPVLLGGCDLCRDTGTILRNAGEWTTVDITARLDEPWCNTVPHIQGVLVK